MDEYQAGDYIKIITDEKEIEGLVIPRPEILEDDIVIIKLHHGYNIGIKKERIKELKVVNKNKAEESKLDKIELKEGLPTVAILSTGGTISSKIDYSTGGVVADLSAEDFVAMIPELRDIANIKAKKIASIMSEDITYEDWVNLAKVIRNELKEVDGVIVTQGTDTLHFTAAVLSFMLAKDLSESNKSIIVTASQKSIDRGSSDAFMNLKCAVVAAADKELSGVMTCLHGTSNDNYCSLLSGTKVRKMHSSRRDAFRPINTQPVGKVFEGGKIEIENPIRFNDEQLDIGFCEKVGMIYTFPGIDPNMLDFFKDYEGLVIVGTGLGNVPLNFFDKIESLIANGVNVVITTQTLYGATHPLVYHNLRMLSVKVGCIFVHDMIPETAFVKMGVVLSQTNDLAEVKRLMQTNLVGEKGDRTMENFLI